MLLATEAVGEYERTVDASSWSDMAGMPTSFVTMWRSLLGFARSLPGLSCWCAVMVLHAVSFVPATRACRAAVQSPACSECGSRGSAWRLLFANWGGSAAQQGAPTGRTAAAYGNDSMQPD